MWTKPAGMCADDPVFAPHLKQRGGDDVEVCRHRGHECSAIARQHRNRGDNERICTVRDDEQTVAELLRQSNFFLLG